MVNAHNQRSPLVQGSLEVPIEDLVSMDSCDTNKQALCRCQNWGATKYKKPIDGHFEDTTAEILRLLQGSDESEDKSSTDESSKDSGSES